MKRPLNLNRYSTQVIAVVVVLIAVIPFVFFLGNRLLRSLNVQFSLFTDLGRISLQVGSVLAFLFFLLVILEQIQDFYIDRVYRKNRHKKIQISETEYECQYCGCRRVHAFDSACPVCGKALS